MSRIKEYLFFSKIPLKDESVWREEFAKLDLISPVVWAIFGANQSFSAQLAFFLADEEEREKKSEKWFKFMFLGQAQKRTLFKYVLNHNLTDERNFASISSDLENCEKMPRR